MALNELPDQLPHIQWHVREKDNVALAWLGELSQDAARAVGVHPEDQRDYKLEEL